MHSLPGVTPIRPGLVFAPSEQTVGAFWVLRQLGQHEGHSRDWQQRYLEGLVAAHGFPAPFPVRHGTQITTRILLTKSRWSMAAVEQWLERWNHPPSGGASATGPRPSADVDDLVREGLHRFRQAGGRA